MGNATWVERDPGITAITGTDAGIPIITDTTGGIDAIRGTDTDTGTGRPTCKTTPREEPRLGLRG